MTYAQTKRGVDAIIVSNHGGRQLDSCLATLDALPEIVDALSDLQQQGMSVPEVYMDGGIRKGSDVVKALALGARAVFIGRPVLWGLTVAGSAGVMGVFDVLREEMRVTMALLGVTNLGQLSRKYLRHVWHDKSKL